MTRALVLGAGGSAAIAWEIGIITGLADEGIDVRDADVFVGTSAGSIVAVQINSGTALEDLFRRQADPTVQVRESPPAVDFVRWRSDRMHAKDNSPGPLEFLRRVGSLTIPSAATALSERQELLAARLPVHSWPDKNILIVAVDAESGERHVFDRTSGARLVDAVAASGAVAGIWPAVPIGARRYIDGGYYSIDNADLAASADRVLILTLPARVPPLCVASLDTAVKVLRAAGARVDVVHPDDRSQAAFASVGGNLLDPAVREQAARAGREQGRALATARGPALWRD